MAKVVGHGRLSGLLSLILAHHTVSRMNRTIGVRVLRWEQRFCTRCSGQLMATAACVALMLLLRVEIVLPIWMAVLSLLPMPAFIDWITQTWSIRESTTPLRMLTGSILGIGVGFQVVAAVRLDWLAFAGGIGVAIVYALAIYLLLRLRPPQDDYMADLIQETMRIVNGRRAG